MVATADIVDGGSALHAEILKIEGFTLNKEMTAKGIALGELAILATLYHKLVMAHATEVGPYYI